MIMVGLPMGGMQRVNEEILQISSFLQKEIFLLWERGFQKLHYRYLWQKLLVVCSVFCSSQL